MCRIFAGQDPARYECETRSVRLNGYSTSIRLERAYWELLDELATGEGVTLPQFLSTLHDEVRDLQGEVRNFTSFLRCTCLIHLERRDAVLTVAAE